MNNKEREEFAVMKNEITHIKQDVSEIKETLISHVKWEAEKYDGLDEKYVHREEWETFQKSTAITSSRAWDLFKLTAPTLLMLIGLGLLKLIGI